MVAWLRETLGFSQKELGALIGASQPLIQAVELGRIRLSERFAYMLERKTGTSAKWLLENKLEPLPDAAKTVEFYERARAGSFEYAYEGHLLPRIILMRTYVGLRLIADELGYPGCKAAGYFTRLEKLSSELLNSIGDLRTRRRVYEKAVAVTLSNKKTLEFILTDTREMMLATKESAQRMEKQKEAIANRAKARRAAAKSAALSKNQAQGR